MTPSSEVYPENSIESKEPVSLKRCSRCHISQRKSNFTKGKRWADGLYPQCKSCVRKKREDTCPKCKGPKDKRAKRCLTCLKEQIEARAEALFRKCPKCRDLLSVEAFGINNSRPDGLQNWCKVCLSTHVNNVRKERTTAERRQPTRICKICHESKPRKDFHKHVNGTRWICISCHRIILLSRTEKRCSKCGEIKPVKEFGVRSRKTGYLNHSCKKCASETARMRNCGVSEGWYEKTLKAQNGKCAICGSAKSGGHGAFHVDHDHRCCNGKFACGKCSRGLLCNNCNTSLGILENTEWVAKAKAYLVLFTQSSKAPSLSQN